MTGSFTSGLGAQLGFAAETEYGTEETPNRFMEFTSEALKLSRAYLESKQLRSGRMFQSSSRRMPTTRSAAGTVAFEVPSLGFGPWLNLFHGETVTPEKQGETSVYKQAHTFGTTDPFKKSLTLQVGRPSTAGVVEPFTYPGATGVSLAISIKEGSLIEATATLDARDEKTATALAAASLPSDVKSFNFTQASILLNEEELKEVEGVDLTIGTPRKVNRFPLGTELKNRPLTNAYNEVKGTIESEYGGNAIYEYFENGTIVPLEIKIVGELLEGTYHEELVIKAPAVGLEGETPDVAGPEVLKQSLPIVVLDNGEEPPLTIEYQSLDATL